jgi:hypothetical protein
VQGGRRRCTPPCGRARRRRLSRFLAAATSWSDADMSACPSASQRERALTRCSCVWRMLLCRSGVWGVAGRNRESVERSDVLPALHPPHRDQAAAQAAWSRQSAPVLHQVAEQSGGTQQQAHPSPEATVPLAEADAEVGAAEEGERSSRRRAGTSRLPTRGHPTTATRHSGGAVALHHR